MKTGLQIDVTVLRLTRSFLNAKPGERQYGDGLAKAYQIKRWQARETLIRLERAGWLKSEIERIDRSAKGRNPRRLYEITPAGRLEGKRVWDLLAST